MDLREFHGVLLDSFGHLDGKLSCRGQHQQGCFPSVEFYTGKKGQGKGGGLAGASLGGSQEVLALEKGRNGLCLDGGGSLVTGGLDRIEDFRGETQFFKGNFLVHKFSFFSKYRIWLL